MSDFQKYIDVIRSVVNDLKVDRTEEENEYDIKFAYNLFHDICLTKSGHAIFMPEILSIYDILYGCVIITFKFWDDAFSNGVTLYDWSYLFNNVISAETIKCVESYILLKIDWNIMKYAHIVEES